MGEVGLSGGAEGVESRETQEATETPHASFAEGARRGCGARTSVDATEGSELQLDRILASGGLALHCTRNVLNSLAGPYRTVAFSFGNNVKYSCIK